MKKLLLGFLLVVQTCWGEEPKTIRLLTVGNSFSQNATHYLKDIVVAQGDVLIYHRAVIDYGTLKQHSDKAHIEGVYDRTNKTLVQELSSEPWDVVTIQQASVESHDVRTYRPYARRLVNEIKKASPKATIALHETWAYRRDDIRFNFWTLREPDEPSSQAIMYLGISSAYRTMARELNLPIIPVGDAFYVADMDPRWGYKTDFTFDYLGAVQPALPDQKYSLHVGWKWIDSKLVEDCHHASMAGQYLGGCVFYESLYDKSIIDCTFVPEGLDREYASFLRKIAHKAVDDLRSTEFGMRGLR